MMFRSEIEPGPRDDVGRQREVRGIEGPSGKPAFRIVERPGSGERGLSCWMALPRLMAADAVPLVAVHGIGRQPEAQARAFGGRAAALGRPVIAPLFDDRSWPRYQQVVRGGRADLALLDLMHELRLAGLWQGPRFAIAGYSGGAQFAHRFAMLYPHLVERLTVTAAGWYTFPEDAVFPYGVGAPEERGGEWGPRLAAGLDAFLSIPVAACVGGADRIPDESTRSRPGLDRRQGRDRLTRATRWIDALKAAAVVRGVRSRAELHVLEGCGHDFGQCVAAGLPEIALAGQPARAGAVVAPD